jgi:glycosidase
MMNLGKQTSMRRCPAGRRAGSLLAGLVLLAGLAPVLSAQTASGVAGKPWFQAAPGPAYQVLVYSFADSNGDGWGDLNGLTARLDYLNDGQPGSGKSLGVSALWLSPIHPAASYHGYDVTDYLGVDPRLGTLADFDRLVAEAHKRGIRIVLDLVFNHSSDSHPWFKAMLKDPAGTYGAYYVKKDPKVSYGQGGMGTWCTRRDAKGDPVNYFAAFWEGMPDLNADNPAVLAEFKNILKFWLGHGVDGFRFDAAKHVFDTNELPQGSSSLARNKAFWADLRTYARGIKPDVWFLGEVISDAATELRAYGASLDSLFDFASAKSLLGNTTSTSIIGLDGRESGIAKVLVANYGQFARADDFVPAPILSNHDQDRAMTVNLNLAGA